MKKWVLLIILLLIIQGISQNVPQQNQTSQTTQPQTDVDLKQLQKTPEQIIPQRQFIEQALEKEIDSTKYVLGPGDQLLIKVWGIMDNQFVTEVTPEGYVIIPAIAEIRVGDKTLAMASKLIKAAMGKAFKHAYFSVRLLKLRKFRVFVAGEISNPGTYYVRAADRVSDVLQLSGGLLNWGNDTRIEVRHLNGTVDTVNINSFYLQGDMKDNPYLQGGDVVYVPPIDLEKNYVIIEGNVGSQGIYQFLPGETIYKFLTRLHAINRRSEIQNIVLKRNGKNQIFNLLEKEALAQKETLQTGDVIVIPSIRDRVYVKGEVAQPGPYPYLANYTARDYAGFAGLLETSKGLDDIYVVHTKSGEVEKGAEVIVANGDIVVVPRRSREIVKDYLSIIMPIISVGFSAYALIRTVR